MKRMYNRPIVEIVKLQSEDVITVSGRIGFDDTFTIGDGDNIIEF